ncbi:hypothetical protein X979_5346 [Burkholderia pseudomallei MSHR7527]|nr:hypothetical protein X979_5346 [Burkholderia pseudomallei MSHR7527]
MRASPRNATPVIAPTISAATAASATSVPIETSSSECMPAVASDLSSATTVSQSVPGTARARISFAAPATCASIGAAFSSADAAASASRLKSSERSVTGLSVSFESACATIWPLRSTSIPKLPGVGWIALTFAITLSIATSPDTTPFSAPSRMIGAANATTSLPVPTST